MRLLLYICLCSAVVSLVRSQVIWGQAVPEATAQLNVLASLFRSRGLLQQKISDIVLDFSTVNWTDITIPAQPTGNISQQCQKDVAQYEADLFQGKTYAMQILDAAGKPPSGILNGNLFWVGSYSQCVNITRKGYNITFDGKFYLATLVPVARAQQSEQLTQDGGAGIPGMGLKLTLGVCVPNSCSQHDVIQRLDGSIYWRFLVQQGILQVTSAYSQESPPIQNVTIAAICICSVLIILLAIGTIYDVMIHQPRLLAVKKHKENEVREPDITVTVPDEKTPLVNRVPREETSAPKEGITGRVLLCFSLYTNIGKLLSTKQAPGSIKCLHGIRFISMTWVILGHTYIFGIQQFENLLEAFETVQTFTFQAIMNATVSVDTFFFLSGLLMSYLLLKQIGKRKENGKSVPYGMLYFHRYWRLTPTYMFVLMLYMWVLPYMFSGPFWPPAPLDPYCGENWWTNLLYVNNVVNDDRMCMGWTWYLANDMQFFVIGVPLVYILYRWQILGIVVKLVLLLASFITTAVISWHFDLKASLTDMVHYYDKPYCRIGPYLVGVAVGWLLVKIKKKQTKSRTLSVLMLVGWLIAATAAMAVLYSVYGQYHGTTLQTQGENVLYLTVHRTVWAMAIGWVVIACYYGYGGVVDIILSWDAWVPLSRLTYCAYLIHILVMYAVYFTREVPIHYSTFTMIYFFLGHVTLSYGLAFLVSVAVEAPLMGLEKILFNK
ncbi:nose resistant to fluoxetine protein 6-like [Branchiostoma floridae]|uniref:Nose resistant to fluoxetine protein 6-like n=1 Tax=Branchiostoma floridae TaxID=7739 RepID=A0A9J7LKX9_BRAFL|nr:nose resistant to fluoxetine protein 6-like [Branchiostoma floridae]